MYLDIGNAATGAAVGARDSLLAPGRTPGEREMGAFARRAVFAEALLAAVRARVAELKTVAK